MDMKTVWKMSGVLAMSLVLAGCGASRLLGGMGLGSSPTPQAPTVQTGNNLALPPDLQLRAPGTAAEANNQINTMPAAPAQVANVGDGVTPVAPAAPAAPKRDIYAEYGISKLKPDGTPKLEADVRAELKQAILKRKREQQPGYGTIRNIGGIFSDG
jgi:hypothetical protein